MKIKKIIAKVGHYARWMKILWHPFKKTAYLLATPTHDNIGDLAIVVAEEKFLKECGYDKIVNIIMGDCWESPKCIARLLPRKAMVYFHGGGNMGDIYLDEHLRRMMLPLLSEREVVLFPETIFYRDTLKGSEEKKNSVKFYNRRNITIAAREEQSFKIMKELYPKANILLTPDIVLSLGVQEFKTNKEGILICFRDDQEKALSNNDIEKIIKELEARHYACSRTSMIYYRHITAGMWEEVVREKMREIASSRLLITDRLHGMIFAALTQTPCIVFGNNHHKISGVYQWLKELRYIQFVFSADEAVEQAEKMYRLKGCRFEFDENAFSELKKVIRQKGGLV